MAAGLQLVFGVQRIVNLACGSFYAIGAYFGITVVRWGVDAGTPRPLFILLLILAGAVLALAMGPVIERLLIRFVYDREESFQLLLTFALVLMFEDIIRFFWGTSPAMLGGGIYLTYGQLRVGTLTIPVYNLLVIAAGGLIAGLMAYFLTRTRLGRIAVTGAPTEPPVRLLAELALAHEALQRQGAHLVAEHPQAQPRAAVLLLQEEQVVAHDQRAVFLELQRPRQVLDGRVLRVFVDRIDLALGAVGLEFAADHVDKPGIAAHVARVIRISRGMSADECLPLPDPLQERAEVRNPEVAGGIGEEDGVVGLQTFRSEHLFDVIAVSAVIRVEQVMGLS